MSRHTLADGIASKLTEEIVGKRIDPGVELDEIRLAERFGTSRTPVREALRQLAASGLVELRSHRAPIVSFIDRQRIGEMFDAMTELEALCAARAARSMTPTERRALERLHHDMGAVMRAGDVARYRLGNLDFHGLIYEGCGNRYLRDLALATRARLAPYRGVQLEAPARLSRSWSEHDGIVSAILRAEAQLAAERMRDHLALTREALEAMASA